MKAVAIKKETRKNKRIKKIRKITNALRRWGGSRNEANVKPPELKKKCRTLAVVEALRVVIEPVVARGVAGGLLQLDDGAIH